MFNETQLPSAIFDKENVIKKNRKKFERVHCSDILPELTRRKIINEMDKQNIEQIQNNKGNLEAMHLLLDRVWRHQTNWYEQFLDVLFEDYQHIVKSVDPDFHSSKYIYVLDFFRLITKRTQT